MFKNIISPVQAWLMSQGRCVGCGTSLKRGKKKKYSAEENLVTCYKCGRVFIHDTVKGTYRRAPVNVV